MDVRCAKSKASGYVKSPSIHVLVGEQPEHQEFFVHQDLICPRSEFFNRAMNGQWQESDDRVVRLPKDHPDTFALYLELLYTNRLPTKDISSRNSMRKNASTVSDPADITCFKQGCCMDEYVTLSNLYVLAERLVDVETKETVLEAIEARSIKHHHYPGLDSIRIIYEGTPDTSPARDLVVELYTSFGDKRFLAENVASIPKVFLYDLSLSLLEKRPLLNDYQDMKTTIQLQKYYQTQRVNGP